MTLTDSSRALGFYRLVRKPVARNELVESCLPMAIAATELSVDTSVPATALTERN
jgi:type IV secretory pathway protease TraF